MKPVSESVKSSFPFIIRVCRLGQSAHDDSNAAVYVRVAAVYYVDGRYHDQYPRRRSRVQEIIVYERGGRYYRMDDRGPHRGHDRH